MQAFSSFQKMFSKPFYLRVAEIWDYAVKEQITVYCGVIKRTTATKQ